MTEMDFRVDFSNVEEKNFDPLPGGRYLLAVSDYEMKECGPGAKNVGAPLIQFEFLVQEPLTVKMNGTDTKVGDGTRKLWTNMMPTVENVLWRLKNFLGALGDDTEGELIFNPAEICARPYERRLLVAKLQVQGKRKDKETGKEYDERNEIKTFYKAETWAGVDSSSSAAASSLLP